MTKRLRLPLLVLLASLTFVFVLMPSPAAADPEISCPNQEGHFTTTSQIYGHTEWTNSCSYIWPRIYCHIGNQTTEYDCVWNGSDYVPTNISSHPPVMCYGQCPYYVVKCC